MGDSKLDTPENLAAAKSTAGRFLCAAAFTPALQERFRTERKNLQPVDYCSQADAKRPPEERDQYQACEIRDTVTGKFEGKTVPVKHRLLFVHSSAKAARQAETRERHLTKVRAEFEQVQKIAGKYSLKTEEAIRRRLEQARGKYREGKLFDYTVKKRGHKFTVTWSVNESELAQWRELDGVFVLRTNESAGELPTAAVLSKYREQTHVEKRIHHVKGPLAVAPMFLKNPQRIAGLLCILVLALTVLSLIERQVRKNLKGEPMYGLLPENRPSPAPTGPKLLKAFATLCVVVIHEHGETHRRLAQLNETQRRILKLLDLPDGALQTFKRRCGT
jgi:transposase